MQDARWMLNAIGFLNKIGKWSIRATASKPQESFSAVPAVNEEVLSFTFRPFIALGSLIFTLPSDEYSFASFGRLFDRLILLSSKFFS